MRNVMAAASRRTLNFTGRRNLAAIGYDIVLDGDGNLSYQVSVPDLVELAQERNDADDIDVVLKFRRTCGYGNRPEGRWKLRDLIRLRGRMSSPLPRMRSPETLGLQIMVKGRDNRFIAGGKRPRPDNIVMLGGESGPGPGSSRGHIRRVTETQSPSGSLLHTRVDAALRTPYDVLFLDAGQIPVEMPILVTHDEGWMSRIKSDPDIQALVFPAVIRRVAEYIATREERGQEPWRADWITYLARLTPSGEFEWLTDGEAPADVDPAQLDERISELLARYHGREKLRLKMTIEPDEEGQDHA